jgi:hypothetical protein
MLNAYNSFLSKFLILFTLSVLASSEETSFSMLTFSHFPHQRRRGLLLFRAIFTILIGIFFYKAASQGLKYHCWSKYPQNALAHQSRLDERHFVAEGNPQRLMDTTAVHGTNGNPESKYRLTNRLHKILSLLPSDSRLEDVVGPIQETGEKMLREVGLKAREFNALFHSWEALHLVQDNDKMLLRADVLQDLKNHPEIAADLQMNHTELVHAFEKVHSFLVRLGNRLFAWTAPYFADHITLHAQFWNASRGIVFTAGDSQAPYLLTSIASIRRLGCDLPIEVMYLGDDDLSEASRLKLEFMPGVATRDMSPMITDDGWKLRGWAAKPFAILLSTFREVVFIDADSIFLQNPAELFLDQDYQKTGALFFKDRLFMPGSKREWLKEILPPIISKNAKSSRLWTGESIHMQESGVVVVDKWRHFVALLLVTRMNGPDRDGSKEDGLVGVYDMVFGKRHQHPLPRRW